MLTVPKSRVVRGFSYFGVSVRLRDLRGRHRHLLGALARARISQRRRAAAAGRRDADARAGRDRRRLGLPIRRAGQGPLAGRTALASRTGTCATASSKAEGVAEVASVGGFVKQYNVVVDPQRLRSFGIPLSKVRDAIRASNMDVGGRTVELSEFEFVVRGRGYLKGIPDLREDRAQERRRHAGPAAGRRAGRTRARRAARHHRAQRRRRSGQRHRPAALRRERARCDRQRQEAHRRDCAGSLPKGVEIQAVYDRSS